MRATTSTSNTRQENGSRKLFTGLHCSLLIFASLGPLIVNEGKFLCPARLQVIQSRFRKLDRNHGAANLVVDDLQFQRGIRRIDGPVRRPLSEPCTSCKRQVNNGDAQRSKDLRSRIATGPREDPVDGPPAEVFLLALRLGRLAEMISNTSASTFSCFTSLNEHPRFSALHLRQRSSSGPTKHSGFLVLRRQLSH